MCSLFGMSCVPDAWCVASLAFDVLGRIEKKMRRQKKAHLVEYLKITDEETVVAVVVHTEPYP